MRCCENKCLEIMDAIDMCIARKNFDSQTPVQKKQSVLEYLLTHVQQLIKPRDAEEVPYYINGYRLCLSAYTAVLGIRRGTFDEIFRIFRDGQVNVVTQRYRNWSKQRMVTHAWLDNYVRKVGDKMPDCAGVHLPCYLDLTKLYSQLKEDLKINGDKTVCYSLFCKMMHEEFSHVKIPKADRFTKCDYCTQLNEERHKTMDKDVRQYLDGLFDFHNKLQKNERLVYYKHRAKAKQDPTQFMCISQDGMDQAKLMLPRLLTTAHAYASARQLKTHLTGVLNDGHFPHGYFDLGQYRHDSNLTINILLQELGSMSHIPDKFYYQLDNCWRENKNQHVMHFLGVLVKLNIVKQIKVNFLMVGHTHEAIDQMFNTLSQYLHKANILTLPDLMYALTQCYTPKPSCILLDTLFDVSSWMKPFSVPLHGITNPHVFKILKAPSGKIVMQYKNWSSVKTEKWKPESLNPEDWILLLKEDVDIQLQDIPEVLQPDKEKMELDVIRKDVNKFLEGSRLFSDEHKKEWQNLLKEDSVQFARKEQPTTWPLLTIVEKVKDAESERNDPQATVGFLGERPTGVPEDLDNMVRNQLADIPEVYIGPYRRPQRVDVVDDYTDLKPDSMVAINLEDDSRPPFIGKVIEVEQDEKRVTIQWWKGGYHSKWQAYPRWGTLQVDFASIIFFNFELDDHQKLKPDARRFLKRRYKALSEET